MRGVGTTILAWYIGTARLASEVLPRAGMAASELVVASDSFFPPVGGIGTHKVHKVKVSSMFICCKVYIIMNGGMVHYALSV